MASITTADNLVTLVDDALVINRLYVAALAFMLYDHLLTLDDEIKHMWTSGLHRFEPGKILFFLNRYMVPLEFIPMIYGNLVPYPTYDLCHGWYTFQQFASLASLAIVQLCLLLRTWILWGATRHWLIILFTLLVTCAVASGVIIAISGSGTVFLLNSSLTMIGCDNVNPIDGRFFAVWIPIFGFDFALCMMSLIKIVEHRRARIRAPLIDLLHRDGMTYFTLSLSLAALNMAMYAAAPLHLKALGVPLLSAALCVACSRMLLNVRTIAGRHSQPTLSDRAPPVGFELAART